jgi:hypothetical protein
MRANPYLFAAYVATWIIHITYLAMIARRYSRLRQETLAVNQEVNQ